MDKLSLGRDAITAVVDAGDDSSEVEEGASPVTGSVLDEDVAIGASTSGVGSNFGFMTRFAASLTGSTLGSYVSCQLHDPSFCLVKNMNALEGKSVSSMPNATTSVESETKSAECHARAGASMLLFDNLSRDHAQVVVLSRYESDMIVWEALSPPKTRTPSFATKLAVWPMTWDGPCPEVCYQ